MPAFTCAYASVCPYVYLYVCLYVFMAIHPLSTYLHSPTYLCVHLPLCLLVCPSESFEMLEAVSTLSRFRHFWNCFIPFPTTNYDLSNTTDSNCTWHAPNWSLFLFRCTRIRLVQSNLLSVSPILWSSMVRVSEQNFVPRGDAPGQCDCWNCGWLVSVEQQYWHLHVRHLVCSLGTNITFYKFLFFIKHISLSSGTTCHTNSSRVRC